MCCTLRKLRALPRYDPSSLYLRDLSGKSGAGWISTLRVARALNFQSVQQLAHDKVASIAPAIDKIKAGREFDVTEWLVDAYAEICMRDQPLSHEEGRCLGVDEVICLYKIRHECSAQIFKLDKKDAQQLVQRKMVATTLIEDSDASLLDTAKKLLAQEDSLSLTTRLIRHTCIHGHEQVLPTYGAPALTIRACDEGFTCPLSSLFLTSSKSGHREGAGLLHLTCASGQAILQSNGNNVRYLHPPHSRF
jgi:hypothetical protein